MRYYDSWIKAFEKKRADFFVSTLDNITRCEQDRKVCGTVKDTEAARIKYLRELNHYVLGKWDNAIEEWREYYQQVLKLDAQKSASLQKE